MGPTGRANARADGAIRERMRRRPRISQGLHPGYGFSNFKQPINVIASEAKQSSFLEARWKKKAGLLRRKRSSQ
jgi:hypothetical protein